MLKILLRVVQIDVMVLQKTVNLKPRFKSEEAPELFFREPAGSVTFQRETLRRDPAEIPAARDQFPQPPGRGTKHDDVQTVLLRDWDRNQEPGVDGRHSTEKQQTAVQRVYSNSGSEPSAWLVGRM